jgi:hypothetical protein
VEHVKNEKNILKQINHPFIVNMWDDLLVISLDLVRILRIIF